METIEEKILACYRENPLIRQKDIAIKVGTYQSKVSKVLSSSGVYSDFSRKQIESNRKKGLKVGTKISRLRAEKRKIERIEEFEELTASGHSIDQIADIFKISRNGLKNWLKKNSISHEKVFDSSKRPKVSVFQIAADLQFLTDDLGYVDVGHLTKEEVLECQNLIADTRAALSVLSVKIRTRKQNEVLHERKVAEGKDKGF